MSTEHDARVVVATGGSAGSRTALERATREAAARGVPLEIVHVVPPPLVLSPYSDPAVPAAREAGHLVLTSAAELVRRLDPTVPVGSRLLTGSLPGAVAHAAQGADLLVIGTPAHDVVGRLWAGWTVMGIVAKAPCPVLVVPDRDTRPRTGEVVVGLESTHREAHALAMGFALARKTQSVLRIVHAWHLASPYDEAIAERLPTPEWEKQELRIIEGFLIDLRMAYPDVQVTVTLAHGRPAPILVSRSRQADLMIISRAAHHPFGPHVGATGRTVIRESRCPVLVVPVLDDVAEDGRADSDTAVAS